MSAVDEARQTVTKRYNAASISMLMEIEETLKAVKWERECIVNTQKQGMGHKQLTFDPKTVKALSDLALAVTRLVEAKIKYDKHSKSQSEEQTPEEEMETVVNYIKQLSKTERAKLLRDMLHFQAIMGDGSVLGATNV